MYEQSRDYLRLLPASSSACQWPLIITDNAITHESSLNKKMPEN